MGEGLVVPSRTRVVASCLAAFAALLVTSDPAVAAPKPITGKLSTPGYTVIALSANGTEAKSVRVRRGRFKLSPPGRLVTLHLRGPDGKYAGPIVVGGGGKRVVVGVKAGARLGRIDVLDGYAKVAGRPSARSIERRRVARARDGVPIGAGNFGRVRSRVSRAGADRDRDGIPGALDIDDDGDLIFDNLERLRRVRGAQSGGSAATFYLASGLSVPLAETVNANASDPLNPLTVSQVDDALRRSGRITLDFAFRAPTELDCGGDIQLPPRPEGLIYCALLPPNPDGSRRSTGRFLTPRRPPFPECCDSDEDGLGSIGANSCPVGADCSEGIDLVHGAGTSEIGTGDVLVQHGAIGGDESRCPPPGGGPSDSCDEATATLQFVYATTPALVSYDDDGAGGRDPTRVQYPVSPGEPGTGDNGFAVRPCPAGAPPPCVTGDIVLTLTFWRPQRRPIGNETNGGVQWIDQGGLTYYTGLAGAYCPESAFPTPPDQNLSTTEADGQGGVRDSWHPEGQPANPANTFTYNVNISECLRDPRGYGVPRKPLTWGRGEERELLFEGTNPNAGGAQSDFAQQFVVFKRQ